MANGAVPYVDLFDHKGPVLFFLEAFGWLIMPNSFGSFLIQWIFMSVNLILIFKMGRLFLNKKWSWVPICFFLLILASTLEGGNLTEELSLPFLFFPLFLVMKYFKETLTGSGKHPPLYAFVYGICFTIIVFIRLNNAVLIGAIILVVMIHLFTNKSYLNFFHNVVAFLAGSLITFAAISSYFIINHAFGDMIYATFLFNMKYAGGMSGISTPEEFMKFCYSISPVIFSVSIGIYYLLKKENKEIGWILTIGSLVTFFSLLLGGVFYHYFTLATPCFVLAIILIIDLYLKNGNLLLEKSYRVIFIGVVILFLVTNAIYLNFFDKMVREIAKEQPNNMYYENALLIKSLIPSSELNSVFGYSVPAGWFLKADITPCYKYFTMQEWWGLYDPQIIVETNEMLENNPPKWIVMNNDPQTNQTIYDILETEYELITQDKVVALYHRNYE